MAVLYLIGMPNMDKAKVKQLLDKTKTLQGFIVNTHDTANERLDSKRKMKQIIDTTSSNKNYVFCVFEI